MLEIGQRAPEFSMYDTDKNLITNQSIAGKPTVLLFIPAAFTSTCTKEFCTVSDDLNFYNRLNANVIGISTDSVYVLRKWKEIEQLHFTLASDYNKEVTAAFGVGYALFNFGMKGTSKRAAVVIDAAGIVMHKEVLENASLLPDFDAIKKVLATQ
jgi:peroxiredoxin